MKTVITVSLGASSQDSSFETDFLGQRFTVKKLPGVRKTANRPVSLPLHDWADTLCTQGEQNA